MQEFLIGLAIIIAVTVVPVMIAARLVGARKTGFGAALFALFLWIVLAAALLNVITHPILLAACSVLGGAAVFAFALDTTMLRGLIVSFLSGLIASALAWIIGAAWLTGSVVTGAVD